MKTSSAKAKGRRLQNKIVDLIRQINGLDQDKGLYEGEIQATPMGMTGIDVKISERYIGKIPVAIECKNQETWKVSEWFLQAKKNSNKKQFPVLIVAKNNAKPLAVVDAETLFKLIKKAFNNDPQNSSNQGQEK